jgi:hypothetical protein
MERHPPAAPVLCLFLVLIIVEWLVFTKLDQLPFYQSWLNNPSFNVFMLAEQSLRLIVTLVIIGVLFLLKRGGCILPRQRGCERAA